MKKILLTGFEPFAGEKINPAQETIGRLQGRQIDGYQIEGLIVPTVFKKSLESTVKKIKEVKPAAVISIGQAGGRSVISIERVAINIDDAVIADNEGNQPIDEIIDSRGKAAYFSSLPVKQIVNALKEKKLPATISNSAGTYVCNHLMYGVLNHIYQERIAVKAGFIHVPYLPEQVVDKPGKASMSLELIVDALKISLQTTINSLDRS